MDTAVWSALALSLVVALAALWSAWNSHRRLQQIRREWNQAEIHRQQQEQHREQRLLDLGEHVLNLERRLNQLQERLLMANAQSGGDPSDSEQARQLRASTTTSTSDNDAEARLRALLNRRDS